MIELDDVLIFSDPPYLVTDYYPVTSELSVRGCFVFSEDPQYVAASFDWSPEIEELDPYTRIDPQSWEQAIRSIKSELDDHCIRYGLRKSPLGEAQ